jgi:hypothetical protein
VQAQCPSGCLPFCSEIKLDCHFSAVAAANQLTVQRLLLTYLSAQNQTMWSLGEVCVTARRICNRSGIPADASTICYTFQNYDAGWSFRIRAVWRCGGLLRPWATHTVIEEYHDDDGRFLGEPEVALAVNEWLRSLSL